MVAEEASALLTLKGSVVASRTTTTKTAATFQVDLVPFMAKTSLIRSLGAIELHLPVKQINELLYSKTGKPNQLSKSATV